MSNLLDYPQPDARRRRVHHDPGLALYLAATIPIAFVIAMIVHLLG